MFLPPVSANSISRLLCPFGVLSHFACNWFFYIKTNASSTLPFSISKNGVVIIYLSVVLLERTVLKPRLNQSDDIKLVLLKHHYKLVKCWHYSLGYIRRCPFKVPSEILHLWLYPKNLLWVIYYLWLYPVFLYFDMTVCILG